MDGRVDSHNRWGLQENTQSKSTHPTISKGTFLPLLYSYLLELIVEQTNKYAAECMGLKKLEKWDKVTVDELCAYVVFMLLMDSPPALPLWLLEKYL